MRQRGAAVNSCPRGDRRRCRHARAHNSHRGWGDRDTRTSKRDPQWRSLTYGDRALPGPVADCHLYSDSNPYDYANPTCGTDSDFLTDSCVHRLSYAVPDADCHLYSNSNPYNYANSCGIDSDFLTDSCVHHHSHAVPDADPHLAGDDNSEPDAKAYVVAWGRDFP